MPNVSNFTAFVLSAIVALGVFQAHDAVVLSFVADQTILAGASNIILVYFILALLIERACEVVMELFTAVGLVPPKSATPASATERARRMMSSLICLTLAVAISLIGLRLVEMILGIATETPPIPSNSFKAADVVLTSFILAGGSEGVHRIMRAILSEKPSATSN